MSCLIKTGTKLSNLGSTLCVKSRPTMTNTVYTYFIAETLYVYRFLKKIDKHYSDMLLEPRLKIVFFFTV